MITENQIQARLAGQATIERKRIAELRDTGYEVRSPRRSGT